MPTRTAPFAISRAATSTADTRPRFLAANRRRPMAQPLDARIAAALGEGARLATVNELIGEVESTIREAQAEHDRLDALSKSATAAEPEAEAAADEAIRLSRRIVRLGAKREQLDARREQLENSERRKRAEAERAAAMATRDQLAADLAERWPVLMGEVVSLLDRIAASDAELQRIGCRVESAEAIARQCSGNFYNGASPLTRLGKFKYPSLTGSGLEELAWPRHVNAFAAQEASMRAHLLQREREKREAAERWKRYVVTPPEKGERMQVECRGGLKGLYRAPEILVMTAAQVEAAEAKGCKVELAKPNETIGLPTAAAFVA
jgi:hypothetical protein